jgi:hypothetical protein
MLVALGYADTANKRPTPTHHFAAIEHCWSLSDALHVTDVRYGRAICDAGGCLGWHGLWIELITDSETPICEFVLTGYSETSKWGMISRCRAVRFLETTMSPHHADELAGDREAEAGAAEPRRAA